MPFPRKSGGSLALICLTILLYYMDCFPFMKYMRSRMPAQNYK
jgi:hypothetical protein